MNKEGVIISNQDESPGEFSRQPLMLGLDFHVISMFRLHRALNKIHAQKLLVYRKAFAHGKNQKRKKVFGKKEEIQKTGLKGNKEYHSVKKRKHILCKSEWYQRSSTLAFIFRTKMQPANQNLPYVILKTKFPFLHASTSLDKKTLTIASNRSFESCKSIPCLAPQNVFRFFHFCRGFCLCLLQFCSILPRPPHRSTEQSR